MSLFNALFYNHFVTDTAMTKLPDGRRPLECDAIVEQLSNYHQFVRHHLLSVWYGACNTGSHGSLKGTPMYLSLHVILVESDETCAEMLTVMLSTLGAEVTHATDLTQASRLLSQLQPDLLVVEVRPVNTRSVQIWLLTRLAATSLSTLLYGEDRSLLDVIARTLPPGTMTLHWPCSQSELAFLLAPLRNRC